MWSSPVGKWMPVSLPNTYTRRPKWVTTTTQLIRDTVPRTHGAPGRPNRNQNNFTPWSVRFTSNNQLRSTKACLSTDTKATSPIKSSKNWGIFLASKAKNMNNTAQTCRRAGQTTTLLRVIIMQTPPVKIREESKRVITAEENLSTPLIKQRRTASSCRRNPFTWMISLIRIWVTHMCRTSQKSWK